MRRRLPSITALTAFDAAARHLSITRAANELALTESAVSRQISLLEEQLGVRLFHRIKKRISLTRAGHMYSARVVQTIERIERDTLEVMGHEGDGAVLEVAALPTVGAQWLVPRLSTFYAQRPSATVHVSARSTRFFFSESALDGALYFGASDWPGARTDYLFDEVLLPVGSPLLLDGAASLDADAIVRCRLLHLMTRPEAWRLWCGVAGLGDVNVMRGPRFEVQSMLISAACAGQGVALLPRFLIGDQLRSGKLKVLADLPVRSEGAYYFAYPEEKAGDALLTEFRAWLQDQSELFRRGAKRAGSAPAAPGPASRRSRRTPAARRGPA
ncbi:Glycine cleavage system transcriptional activator [Pigmentiphaga humi]|uniref:Glycine cleavage system transcriptional activator n=1 Tax=Pigmentiphaga humi TaxID=2478468 RepID=A0A3P4B875_9BURK|nr:LysR substrate-binding domain-containing protein [Pigmentiphaga humi]VCU71726.1 Glycine cleavage system transcriptional activator [Pigmentiphaga humi]